MENMAIIMCWITADIPFTNIGQNYKDYIYYSDFPPVLVNLHWLVTIQPLNEDSSFMKLQVTQKTIKLLRLHYCLSTNSFLLPTHSFGYFRLSLKTFWHLWPSPIITDKLRAELFSHELSCGSGCTEAPKGNSDIVCQILHFALLSLLWCFCNKLSLRIWYKKVR